MTGSRQWMEPPAGWADLGNAVWPTWSPEDSATLRRRKLAVRSGHLGMVILVGVAVIGSLVFGSPSLSGAANLALVAFALLYIGWNLIGTRSLVRIVLSDGQPLARVEGRRPVFGAVTYFGVQLVLASVVYWLGDRGRIPNLVWLALLPPVAYAVFFLRWRGIALVTLASLGVVLAGGTAMARLVGGSIRPPRILRGDHLHPGLHASGGERRDRPTPGPAPGGGTARRE